MIFAPQNLIMDPPFTKMDIVSCRNLLIYLSPELQKGLLPLFHYSLNPGGVLFLGKSETIGEFTDLFAMLDDKARLYRRIDFAFADQAGQVFLRHLCLSVHAPQPASGNEVRVQSPDRWRINCCCRSTRRRPCWSTSKGDILYISGRTGKYLEPAAGKVNWNIFAMAREGLRYELDGALSEGAPAKRSGYPAGMWMLEPTVKYRRWTSPSRPSRSLRRCGDR